MNNKLDLITIGRSSIDLYGSQVGGRLEDMGSFNKYIGGSQRQSLVGNPLQYQTLGLNISKQMAREVGLDRETDNG